MDSGAAVNVMYEQLFRRLDPDDKAMLQLVDIDIIGFVGEPVQLPGQLILPMTLQEGSSICIVLIDFVVLSVISKLNLILGRPGMASFFATASTIHSLIMFPHPKVST